jgi:membrane associated rhomboid family serine protease
MFNFLVFGSLVEFDQYTLRTIGINIIAILGGAFGVGWQVRTTKQNLNVMGASGGVYGLLSSQISNLALNWKDLGNVQKWAYVITLTSTITTDIVVNIIYYNPQISYSNHIGGFLFGILGGLCIMKNITEIPWEKKMIIIAGSLLGVCSLVSAINLGMVHQVVEAS